MIREPSWDLYRTFGAVLRHGSLSGAGRVLGLTQPTVARQIDALEEALGLQLFVRNHRGLAPTAAALRLQPYAETLFQTSAGLLRAVSDASEIGGTVRITAGETVGIEFLPPILAGLRKAYPALHLELSVSDAIEDIMQRKADIAVRMVEPVQKTLTKRHVNTVEFGLYAHASYVARRGLPLELDDLRAHDIIGFDTDTPVLRASTEPYPWLQRAHLALRTDSASAQLAAIRSGLGIGYHQSRVADRTPGLVRVLPEKFALRFAMWVVMHGSSEANPACATVFEAVAAALAELP